MTQPWFALRVRGGYDIGRRQSWDVTVAEDLTRDLGVNAVALPLQTVMRWVKRNKRRTLEPVSRRSLVPGYVFCTRPWPGHKHVRGVLMAGDAPYAIPGYQIGRMMTAAQSPAYEEQPARRYKIGDVVQVTGLDVPVTIARLNDDGSISCVIRMLGAMRNVRVRPEQIAA